MDCKFLQKKIFCGPGPLGVQSDPKFSPIQVDPGLGSDGKASFGGNTLEMPGQSNVDSSQIFLGNFLGISGV